jgi:DNA-binding NtrC family response regulator
MAPARPPRPSSLSIARRSAQTAFEADLLGHSAGAAAEGAIGKLKGAAGGTILLDEIGDLQQATLLRLLEERKWQPIGSATPHPLEARMVCATNEGLLGRARAGGFREDLHCRLNGGHNRLPPLRERRADIVPLAEIMLRRSRQERGRGPQPLTGERGRIPRGAAMAWQRARTQAAARAGGAAGRWRCGGRQAPARAGVGRPRRG